MVVVVLVEVVHLAWYVLMCCEHSVSNIHGLRRKRNLSEEKVEKKEF